jgi:hypothetical protein
MAIYIVRALDAGGARPAKVTAFCVRKGCALPKRKIERNSLARGHNELIRRSSTFSRRWDRIEPGRGAANDISLGLNANSERSSK